jgi:hypothetical protein
MIKVRMLPLTIALLLGLSLAAAGCGKGLLFPGLKLPAGSEEVARSAAQPSGPAFPTIPPLGSASEVQSVAFNNGAGWDSVAGHFDAQLGGQGYTDAFSAAAGGDPVLNPMSTHTRMYTKTGEKYVVVLQHDKALSGEAAPAEFTLTTIRFE